MTGGSTAVRQDVPPYVVVSGNPAKAYGLNVEGLKRRGFAPETIARLTQAYRTLYRSGLTLEQAREALAPGAAECPELQTLLEFVLAAGRGIVR
jgi:UDP-N-acetylglucosamine acyltransferase